MKEAIQAQVACVNCIAVCPNKCMTLVSTLQFIQTLAIGMENKCLAPVPMEEAAGWECMRKPNPTQGQAPRAQSIFKY